MLFAVTASTLSFLSSFWCRNVDFKPAVDGFPTLSFGVFSYQTVEFGSINGEVFALKTCAQYPDYVDMDPYWKTAYAFSIMAPIVGILTSCAICIPQCKDNPSTYKLAGLMLMVLVTLFQGSTMFLLRSDLCDGVPLTSITSTYGGTYPDSCEMGVGMKLSITATVLWFVTGLSMIACGSGGDDDGPGGDAGNDEK